MLALSKVNDLSHLDVRLRDAPAATAGLFSEVIGKTCRSFASVGEIGKTAKIERLVQSEAWTDAVLALIDLELPQWQLRRLAYDEGEWHCALSCQRELPEWLDQSIEAHHADLSLAILSAFVNVQRVENRLDRSSVPIVSRKESALYEPVLI
jgi:hypothetical protein